jgi:hypothetical protein
MPKIMKQWYEINKKPNLYKVKLFLF